MSADDNATRRTEARERRRAAVGTNEKHTDGDDSGAGGGLETAARAAATAAALGAVLGAVKALAGHDDDETAESEPATATQQHEDEDDEPTDGDDAPDHEEEPSATAGDDEHEPAERQQQRAAPSRPREGASSGAVRSIAAHAREQLRGLQGRDADSITALERIDDGWRVTCEVVEVERIPNSTDVLATYVIELDGDGELIAFERVRRYYRAQADLGGE